MVDLPVQLLHQDLGDTGGEPMRANLVVDLVGAVDILTKQVQGVAAAPAAAAAAAVCVSECVCVCVSETVLQQSLRCRKGG